MRSVRKLVIAETSGGWSVIGLFYIFSWIVNFACFSLIKTNEFDITPASLPLYTLLILLELNKVLYPIIIDCGIAAIYLESNF